MEYKLIHGGKWPYLGPRIQGCESPIVIDGTLLVRPRSRLLTFGDRAFSSAAPRLWNQLPSTVKEIASISAFKVSLS
jgi:hypothetical protein